MLIDTSALLRTLQPGHPQREVVRSATKILTAQGRNLHILLFKVAHHPKTGANLVIRDSPTKSGIVEREGF